MSRAPASASDIARDASRMRERASVLRSTPYKAIDRRDMRFRRSWHDVARPRSTATSTEEPSPMTTAQIPFRSRPSALSAIALAGLGGGSVDAVDS